MAGVENVLVDVIRTTFITNCFYLCLCRIGHKIGTECKYTCGPVENTYGTFVSYLRVHLHCFFSTRMVWRTSATGSNACAVFY